MTWRPSGDNVIYEMGAALASSQRYVAMGLSSDQNMVCNGECNVGNVIDKKIVCSYKNKRTYTHSSKVHLSDGFFKMYISLHRLSK